MSNIFETNCNYVFCHATSFSSFLPQLYVDWLEEIATMTIYWLEEVFSEDYWSDKKLKFWHVIYKASAYSGHIVDFIMQGTNNLISIENGN